MISPRLALGTCIVHLAVGGVTQEIPAPTQQPEVLHTQANVVLVPTLVKDKSGAVVYGLTAADFIVEDDGVAQPIQMDEEPAVSPISLVVAIQLGRTAAAELPRIRTLGSMLDPVLSSGINRAAIVTFDEEIELARGFTSNGALIAGDLKRLRAGGEGAAILDAIGYSAALLKDEPPERRRVLLLVSESRDHGSRVVSFEDTVRAITDSNILVYALAFSPTASNVLDDMRGKLEQKGDWVNLGELATKLTVMAVQAMRRNTPSTVAALTGGEYELFTSAKGFEARMTEFTNHLSNRYLLSFEPKDPHPGLHEISVRLRRSNDYHALARERYWAGPPDGR